MFFQTVIRSLHGGDSALCPGAGTVQQRALGDHRNLLVISQFQREGQSRQAATDDEGVKLEHDEEGGKECRDYSKSGGTGVQMN